MVKVFGKSSDFNARSRSNGFFNGTDMKVVGGCTWEATVEPRAILSMGFNCAASGWSEYTVGIAAVLRKSPIISTLVPVDRIDQQPESCWRLMPSVHKKVPETWKSFPEAQGPYMHHDGPAGHLRPKRKVVASEANISNLQVHSAGSDDSPELLRMAWGPHV
ncbi:hypothetical protein AC579_3098 [Pseudocercospora musae]|uniref:Uncharacterized protein n=1 Tax=Pseudocercospora musae TaxID=113226 RepID=A0A139I9F0_9PEZI|nr:hypothetical protein AC579_311 [Pseudocercospora musae]KXT11969.1 hypothetical protein AC579_3098 [Pseudocercospora musae]